MLDFMKKYSTESTDKFRNIIFNMAEREINQSVTVTMVNLVDASEIEAIRRSRAPDSPTYTSFVAKALAQTLIELPFANVRSYRPFGIFPRRLQRFNGVDISIVSEVKDPRLAHVVFAAVLSDVEKKSLDEIMAWLKRYRDTETVPQWRTFKRIIRFFPQFAARIVIGLPVHFPRLWSRFRGGAALISSPAKYGVDQVLAAWTSPIGVCFGLVKSRPLVKDGHVVACPSFYLTFNFDRRLISGAQGAIFLNRLCSHLEKFSEIESDAGGATRSLIFLAGNPPQTSFAGMTVPGKTTD